MEVSAAGEVRDEAAEWGLAGSVPCRASGLYQASGSWSQQGWLSRWRSGEESACQCRRHRRRDFNPWVGRMPWRRNWQPTPVFLPGESWTEEPGGSSPGGHKQSEASEHKHEHQPQATTASLDSSTTATAQPRPPQPEAPESSTRLQLACSCGVRGLRWVMTSPHCERRTTAPVCMEQRSSGTHLRSPAGGARAGSQAPGLF